ncbi:unnamed protein product [Danaus chrysippus]|uniref:(African queen) hypothetical protein n=1 Tax=Danaus chrysippus TaxID=151541 RepID=A0A8J2QI42_9NEOP|nr:unnamed protein product [Danaus chrysippus]
MHSVGGATSLTEQPRSSVALAGSICFLARMGVTPLVIFRLALLLGLVVLCRNEETKKSLDVGGPSSGGREQGDERPSSGEEKKQVPMALQPVGTVSVRTSSPTPRTLQSLVVRLRLTIFREPIEIIICRQYDVHHLRRGGHKPLLTL